VTLIVFSDYGCASCKTLDTRLRRLLTTHGDSLAILVRHIPLVDTERSFTSARTAVCADLVGQFPSVHQWLFDGGRPTAQHHYEAAVEHLIANRTSRSEKDMLRRQLLAIPRPTTLPAYFALLVDPGGWLWVVTSPHGEGMTVLEGRRPDGTAAGELRLPVELQVFEVGHDYVLGAEATVSGEQRVLVWRFQRQ
jgi:hypothetical protein